MKAAAQIRKVLSFLAVLSGFTASAPAAESRLWVVEEPREGLLQDAEAYARVGSDSWLQHGARSYVSALESFHDLLAASPEGSRAPRLFYFFCTVYFTPVESGFEAGRGFDLSPDTRSAFGGRKYPKSFLKAVVMEGFGRITEPVGGKSYMKYDGTWGFGKAPLGNRNNVLRPRLSAAVHRGNPLFSKGSRFFILDPEIYNVMGSMEWEAADTGGGLYRSQIDLYWGEDDPKGPWPETALAAGCPLSVQWIVPVVFPR